MPAATLNQFRCELRPQSCDGLGEVFYWIGLAPRFVDFFKRVQQFNLLALTTFAVPNASFFFFMAARFKLLSV